MDEQFGDELRALRQRAYGPNADIQEDAEALARLRELEARAASRPFEPAEPGEAGPALAERWDRELPKSSVSSGSARHEYGGNHSGAAAGGSLDDAGTDEFSLSSFRAVEHTSRIGYLAQGIDDAADTPVDEPERAAPEGELADSTVPGGTSVDAEKSDPPRARRKGALVWAGALTAALLVGAILSYIAVGLTPGSVGVLQVDPGGDWPDDFSPRESGSEIFEEFHGLTILLVPQEWNGGAPSPCLFILTDASEGLIAGAGCGAGDFEPITAVTVTEQMPQTLIDVFPVGTALQFQLDDGEVVVFADLP